jgi:hypothetical protein
VHTIEALAMCDAPLTLPINSTVHVGNVNELADFSAAVAVTTTERCKECSNPTNIIVIRSRNVHVYSDLTFSSNFYQIQVHHRFVIEISTTESLELNISYKMHTYNAAGVNRIHTTRNIVVGDTPVTLYAMALSHFTSNLDCRCRYGILKVA